MVTQIPCVGDNGCDCVSRYKKYKCKYRDLFWVFQFLPRRVNFFSTLSTLHQERLLPTSGQTVNMRISDPGTGAGVSPFRTPFTLNELYSSSVRTKSLHNDVHYLWWNDRPCFGFYEWIRSSKTHYLENTLLVSVIKPM